jgi:hypothetical protein
MESWASKRHKWLEDVGSDEVAAEFPESIANLLQSASSD